MTVVDLGPDIVEGPSRDQPDVEDLDVRRVTERIDAVLGDIAAVADPRVLERAEDLVGLLMRLYGAGIRRIMEIADEAGLLEGELLDGLARDELVSSLLVIHDLHPLDLETRVRDALDRVRPYLGSHGGDVEIVGIDGDVVRLRMQGSCSSCPSSTVTLNYAIEKAILEAAPEIARIEADDVHPEQQPTLIQLEPRRGARPGASNGADGAAIARSEWVTLDAAARPGRSGIGIVDLGGIQVLLCRAGTDLYAYRDHCANCGSTLADGRLVDAALSCPTCGHAFDVRRAGRSIGEEAFHLEPLPLLSEDGAIRVAVPAAAVLGTGGVGSGTVISATPVSA